MTKENKFGGSQNIVGLMEAILDPLVVISVDGKIADANTAMAVITGFDASELVGKEILGYFTDIKNAEEICADLFENGSVKDKFLAFKHKDGRAVDILFNGSVYKNEKGELTGAVIVARDIAEHKWALELLHANKALALQNKENEKSAAALILANYARGLIEASRDPLVTISPEGKITDMNEALANVTGMTREELKGTDFFDYFTEPQRAREVYQEVFAMGFVADSPLTLRHIDGKLTDVLFNGSVYKDSEGKVVGVVIVARDTTEQQKITRELTEAIVFAELATGFAEEARVKAENATLIAESAVKSKQQFLSNMSHEIRTPMNAIIGFTKVLLKTELTTRQKEYLTAIKLSGDALIVLINDILDLAKVDAGKMQFEQVPFKMTTSLSAMLHLFETKIHEKNLKLIREFDSKIPDILVGDPVRLHQIIINLVSNAVKFTNKGKITMSVRLISENDESVRIQFSVSDTGIGIPENKIERVFENFQQASSGTSRLYGGTGLGLAIVKQLVEAQNGTINVRSKVGEGSTFSFELEFLKSGSEIFIEPQIDEFEGDVKNVRVLVAEDIPLNQLLMKTLLDDFGFECEIAENGRIAVEKLQNKTFSVVLMDLQMPMMNGFEATDYIRNVLHSDIPIIALTADVTTVDLAKCKAVGMNDYIAKPVDERLLYGKIVGAVKKTNSTEGLKDGESPENQIFKYTDLDYLTRRTKSNPELMMEMITLYLDQTPALVSTMKRSTQEKDWKSLYSAVHKLIPSFSIMGINANFENMAKKVQEYASTQQQSDGILDLVMQLEVVCTKACEELREELIIIKNGNNE